MNGESHLALRKAACFVLLALAACGCTRRHYRLQADNEITALVSQKAWSAQSEYLDGFTVAVDPRSRMFDPFNPDRPPMPPDDPTSHRLMHCVDCKKGYPHWHVNGDTPYVENPEWLAYLPVNEEGAVVLDLDNAVRVALMHSREYQQNRETLYLSALDVSAERFQFDTQFFGGYEAFYTADGPDRRGGGGQSRSTLELNTFSTGRRDLAIEKSFTTGADLVVGLANSLVWQLSGPNDHTATTLLDFALLQPLLRGAGRDRVMETLTLSERTLLANVRQMERYRRGFVLDVTMGRNAGQGPSRRGGVFGASGLSGFTGVGTLGFNGGLGGQGAGGNQNAAVGAQGAQGYLGLLQQQQNIRNQEFNIAQLRASLLQLQALAEAGRTEQFQVQQARQQLYDAESILLNLRNNYENQLDALKIQLGLPPQLPVVVQDTMLDQFNLIDSEGTEQQNQLTDLRAELGPTVLVVLDAGEGAFVWSDAMAQRVREVKARIADVQALQQILAGETAENTRRDIAVFREALPERLQAAEDLKTRVQERIRERGDEIADEAELLPFDPEELRQLPEELDSDLAGILRRVLELETDLAELQVELDNLLAEGPSLQAEELQRRLRTALIQNLLDAMARLADYQLEMTLVQARARTESLLLPRVEMTPGVALEVARANREDWMNARAQLVDAWRLIEFNADNLEGTLNLVFSGDIQNTGDNPIRLRGTTGRLRVGVQFDAPITRLLERNTYRQSLIEYQQARRRFYAFEDGVAQTLRAELRQIELNQLNFELLRAAVVLATEQVEFTRLRLKEPPAPGVTAVSNPTLARDLIDSLTRLLNAQDNFLSVWVNYEVQRMNLDFDMGTMQVDYEGLWIDPGEITLDYGAGLNAAGLPCAPNLLVPPGAKATLSDGETAPLDSGEPLPELEEVPPPDAAP